MSTATLNGTATLRDLLFGEAGAGSAEVLADSLRKSGTVRAHVPGPIGLNAVIERELASETDKLLSTNLADVAIAGWKRYDELMEAARRTRNSPDEEVVAMATHTIETSQQPRIEVFIDGRSAATVNLELKMTFATSAVLAVVRQGWLTGLRAGTFLVTGSIAAQQTVLTQRQRQFDLPGAIWLRGGVPLLADDRPRPVAVPSQ